MTTPLTIFVQPVLPVPVLVLLAVAAGVAVWFSYGPCALQRRNRILLWAFRMAAVLVCIWLLLQAQRRTVRRQLEPPALAVVLDVSASMTEQLGSSDSSRATRALDFLEDPKVRKLCEDYRVFRYELGAETTEMTTAPPEVRFNAPRTHIGSGLNRVADRLRAENLAGIILLSDGLDHSGAEWTPETRNTPVFIPELETPQPAGVEAAADFWVAELSFPRLMVVGWKASVDVLVRRRGSGNVRVPIHLRAGGQSLRTSVLEFQDDEPFLQASFTVEPTAVGQQVYRIEIQPGTDADPENNTREFLIEVTDPKNRVLYLEGVPRWEFKFFKRALLTDKNYQLSAFVLGAGGHFVSFDEMAGMAGAELPTFDKDALAAYRVIVLGELPATALTTPEWEAIRAFTDKGGGLLLLGAATSYGTDGLQTLPELKPLFPALSDPAAKMNEGRFAVDFSAAGRTHAALKGLPRDSNLPPLLSFWAPVEVNEFSSTLVAAADGSPVVVVRRYGQGRVVMVLSDSLWRWQLGADSSGTDRELYRGFMTQLVHWLAPSAKELEQGVLLQAVTATNEVEVRQRVSIGALYEARSDAEEETLTCTITTPTGQPLRLPMVPATLGNDVGLSTRKQGYRCVFTPQDPGRYEAVVAVADGTQETKLLLLATRPEHERTGAPLNRAYLQQLADATGGRFVQWQERIQLFNTIPGTPREKEIVDEYPLWNRWWWLLVLVALFTVEWWYRRRLDLI